MFADGYYHGRIILPSEYPMKPPSIILLTPSGRFEVNKKICLSISGHHPESWQPCWSIRTALLAIIGFMPSEGRGAVGSLDYGPDERRQLALTSHSWSCPSCGLIKELLRRPSAHHTTAQERAESEQQRAWAKQICFKNSLTPGEGTSAAAAAAAADAQQESSEEGAGVRQRTLAATAEASRQESPATSADEGVSRPATAPTASTRSESLLASEQNLASDESSGQFTTYLMFAMAAALAFLLFRRLFLL